MLGVQASVDAHTDITARASDGQMRAIAPCPPMVSSQRVYRVYS